MMQRAKDTDRSFLGCRSELQSLLDEPAERGAGATGAPAEIGQESSEGPAPLGLPPSVRSEAPCAALRPAPLFLGAKVGADGATSRFCYRIADQPNAFMLATGASGSGKTEFLRVVGTLLSRQGLPVLAVDFHGDLNFRPLLRRQLGAELGLNPLAVQAMGGSTRLQVLYQLLRQALPDIGHVQQALLKDGLQAALEKPQDRPANLHDVKAALFRVGQSSNRASAAAGLSAALDSIFDDPVFAPRLALDVDGLLCESQSLDLSHLARPVQIVAAGALLVQLFEKLRDLGPVSGRGLRLFVLLDEAAILRESAILETLVRESRKYGLGLAIATQEVRGLAKSLLSNASTAAVFRQQSRTEAKAALDLLPGASADTLLSFETPGECLFRDSSGVQRVRIYDRKSAERKK